MTEQIVYAPSFGEGLNEAIVVELKKEIADFINKDEILYTLETKKTVLDVESPYEGIIKKWFIKKGNVVKANEPIAQICAQLIGSNTLRSSSNVKIPPRSKAYCKAHGISQREVLQIPARTSKLMPSDIDAYLHNKSYQTACKEYKQKPISEYQKRLNFNFKQSFGNNFPTVIVKKVFWDLVIQSKLELSRLCQINARVKCNVSEFFAILYAVVQTAKRFPKFRSIDINDGFLREYDDVNIGFSVESYTGDLNTGVILGANKLSVVELLTSYEESLKLALEGQQQVLDSVQIILSFLGDAEIDFAIPMMVFPSTATLFVGSPNDEVNNKKAKFVLVFNHSVVNGMEAAEFLKDLNEELRTIGNYGEKSYCESKGNEKVNTDSDEQIKNKLYGIFSELLEQDVDLFLPLGDQGLDSIKAVKLIAKINQHFSLNLAPTFFWHYPTFADVSVFLTKKINSANGFSKSLDQNYNTITNKMESSVVDNKTEPNNSLADRLNSLLSQIDLCSDEELALLEKILLTHKH